jgi:dTDP-4-dehydrorhamnose 3,5-epimerase
VKFIETPLQGAFVIELKAHSDERGFFARSFCRREFADHGITFDIVQSNISFNRKVGTLRGMHFQRAPVWEPKLVRCSKGRIHDVIIDLRSESPTCGEHFAVELSGDSLKALFIPREFAHGFQTLEDYAVIEYQMGEYYTPALSAGIRYDDPAFGIRWPLPVSLISKQDLAWTPYQT